MEVTMSHNFRCSSCNRWIANCGYSDNNHSTKFHFSTTCGCGKFNSDSCGGRKSDSEKIEENERLHSIECGECKTQLSLILKKEKDTEFSVDVSCPNCGSKEYTVKEI
jgi:DNA-directed RNA polymerase subunit RPC12/RpoP